MVRYLDIGDRVKMILDDKNIKISEHDRMILAGAIAAHMQMYAEQEIDMAIRGALV